MSQAERKTLGGLQSDRDAAKDAEQKRVNSWNTGLTLAIAICAGLQVIGIGGQIFVYLKQTNIMRDTLEAIKRQADTMDAQAKKATEDAIASAVTTKDTLDAIQRQAKELSRQNKNLISRERARIAVKIIRLEWLDFYRINKVIVDIENFGPTHALNVRTKGYARPLIDGFDDPEFELDDLVFPVETVIRSSSKSQEGSMLFYFPEEWVPDIEQDQPLITIEAKGLINYEDVFGQSHETAFKYFMKVPSTYKISDETRVEVHPFSQWRTPDDPNENRAT